jgi:YbgC/YbaW family acyl-CoA thioester hydrolase
MTVHVERMRVNWVDTDASGGIHYTAALRYSEVAEHALMRTLFADGMPGVQAFGLPRVHVEADFRVALHYPDEFECAARITAVGRSSVTYGYEIRRPDGTLCIVGRIVAVCVGPDGGSMPLPEPVRATLLAAV